MRKKLALLVLSLSAIAAAGMFSSPLQARCVLHECLNGDVVTCCTQIQFCCPPIES